MKIKTELMGRIPLNPLEKKIGWISPKRTGDSKIRKNSLCCSAVSLWSNATVSI